MTTPAGSAPQPILGEDAVTPVTKNGGAANNGGSTSARGRSGWGTSRPPLNKRPSLNSSLEAADDLRAAQQAQFLEAPGAKPAEAYGFVGWITSAVVYVVFLLWAYLPESVLHSLGLTYYPSKYWALAVPAYLSVAVVCVFWIYESLNMMSTPALDALNTLHDEHARAPEPEGRPDSDEIPAITDIPITVACQVLYGPGGVVSTGTSSGAKSLSPAGGRRGPSTWRP